MAALSAGQTLTAAGIAPSADFPAPAPPVFVLSLAAKNRNDEVKLSGALHKIVEEDPSLSFEQRGETHELLLRGQGEMHLKVAVDKLAGRYNVAVETSTPRVAYRETIQAGTQQHARYKRQTGGHGQFADVTLEIAPRPRGEGFQFIDRIVGGAVPKEYIPGVQKGLESIKDGGLLAGFPLIDFKATLTDGKFHDVDSSVLAFEIAARAAFRELKEKGAPKLLEPIMAVEVVTPEEYLGSVIGDLNGRRGMIQGQDMRGNATVVNAFVPLANMFGYVNTLRGMSQGRAQFTMQYDHYEPVPQHVADEVIKKHSA